MGVMSEDQQPHSPQGHLGNKSHTCDVTRETEFRSLTLWQSSLASISLQMFWMWRINKLLFKLLLGGLSPAKLNTDLSSLSYFSSVFLWMDDITGGGHQYRPRLQEQEKLDSSLIPVSPLSLPSHPVSYQVPPLPSPQSHHRLIMLIK